jgi:hypothetical protein
MTTPTPPSPYTDLTPGVRTNLLGMTSEEPALEVAHAAGTPLSALASTEEAAGSERSLERLDAHVELADGTAWDVRILNRDFVSWDLTRAKRNWPQAEDAAFLLNNFLAFCASKRAGHYSGTFEAFVDAADLVKLTRADAARPTQPGAGPASS